MHFITDHFLLEGRAAQRLYHEYASAMPIIDYHCHLNPVDVAQDRHWNNLAQLWLHGDHYKWRQMRWNGIDERYCTGNASDHDKFLAFAETMPYLLRNPLYHWSHLELLRSFGIKKTLTPKTAPAIWSLANEQLTSGAVSALRLIRKNKVEVICTTDDPTDNLMLHQAVATSVGDFKMLPTWRPDKALTMDRPEFWNAWVDTLASSADVDIGTYDDFLSALQKRHAFFEKAGCRLSDYGVETIYAEPYTEADVKQIFTKARRGRKLAAEDVAKFRSAMMVEFGRMDARSNWTWQIHYNALRNNNVRLFPTVGADAGFDSIGAWDAAQALSRLLGRLDAEEALPRTILYSLNPNDTEMLASMCGNFQRGPIPGKLQVGSAWWFNDQKDGMERHLGALSQLGLLSRFVGMLTDSRSFLSYARHEYFRRILCNLLGGDMDKGLLPQDYKWMGKIVRDICYHNAVRYFGFEVKK